MKHLIEFIAKSIVDNPKSVLIEEIKNDNTGLTEINLKLASEDMGKIIGKKGRIISAIRNLGRVRSIITSERTVLVLKED